MKNVATKHNYDEGLIFSYDENANFLCSCNRKPQHIATLTSRGTRKLKCCLQKKPLDCDQNDIDRYKVWLNEEELSQQKGTY